LKLLNEFCIFPVPETERERILSIVKSGEDMLLYFVKQGGLKLIKDSFDHDASLIEVLEEILKMTKLREEYQKVNGYEKLIDYMDKKSHKD